MFKVIIAGSREFRNYEFLKRKCDKALSQIKDDIIIISGCANGADSLGEKYAQERGYYLMECPAPWGDVEGKPAKQLKINSRGEQYWTLAGLYRNQLMAEEADALIAFDMGTPGTKDMIKRAEKQKIKIKVYECS